MRQAKLVVVAVEGDAQIVAHDREQMLRAAGEAEFGVGSLPGVGQECPTDQVAGDEESIADSADPRAGGADFDVVEEVVGGIGDEGAVFGVGAGEGDGRRGGFENAVVGDVAGEDRGV